MKNNMTKQQEDTSNYTNFLRDLFLSLKKYLDISTLEEIRFFQKELTEGRISKKRTYLHCLQELRGEYYLNSLPENIRFNSQQNSLIDLVIEFEFLDKQKTIQLNDFIEYYIKKLRG